MEIKDSGNRRAFESGAVRDMSEDKGRCDLLPLYEVGTILDSAILININEYVRKGDIDCLVTALKLFCVVRGWNICTAMLEVSIHYEHGAIKYVERNWEKGIPIHSYIDSAVRHYLKWMRGDNDEPHDRAFVWNILSCYWTHNNKPELIDLPFATDLNGERYELS